MFNQPADAPVPVPPTEFGLRAPPASASSTGGNRGLYGNRIPSFGSGGPNIPSGPPMGRRVPENRGMIGNRIPSLQSDGKALVPSEGEVPAPKTPSSTGVSAPAVTPAPESQVPETVPLLDSRGSTPAISDIAAADSPPSAQSPSTPKSTLAEPPSTNPSWDDISDIRSEPRTSADLSRTASSLSVAHPEAVPSSLYVESDTSSRQPMHDVSGVSTPTGTPKMSRLDLAEDPASSAPAGAEAVESRYDGFGLGMQKMDLNDPQEALAPDADVEDLVVSREEPQVEGAAGAKVNPLATPSAERHEYVKAADLAASGSAGVPVDIEEAEETEAVMGEHKSGGADEPAIAVEVEDEAREEAGETAVAKDEVTKENIESDVTDLAGKQVEIEPVHFIAPRQGNVEAAPAPESASVVDNADIDANASSISQADFPSVPHDDLQTPVVGDNNASGANSPIDPTFLKVFPSVPVEDGTPATELGSPDIKVRVEVHVATSPQAKKTETPKGGEADATDALSPRASLDSSADSSADHSSKAGSPSAAARGRNASPSPAPRTAIEDAEDDGEGGWAKVEVKKKR